MSFKSRFFSFLNDEKNKKCLTIFVVLLLVAMPVVNAFIGITTFLLGVGSIFLSGVLAGYVGYSQMMDATVATLNAEVNDLEVLVTAQSNESYYTYSSSLRLFSVQTENDVSLANQLMADSRNYVYELAKYKALVEYNRTSDPVSASTVALMFVDDYYANLTGYYVSKETAFLSYVVDLETAYQLDVNPTPLLGCIDLKRASTCINSAGQGPKIGGLVYNYQYGNYPAPAGTDPNPDCPLAPELRVSSCVPSFSTVQVSVGGSTFTRNVVEGNVVSLRSTSDAFIRVLDVVPRIDSGFSQAYVYDRHQWDFLFEILTNEHNFVHGSIGGFVDMLLTQASPEELDTLMYDPGMILALTRDIGENGSQSDIMLLAEFAMLGKSVPENLSVSTMTLNINGTVMEGLLAGDLDSGDVLVQNVSELFTGYFVSDGNIYFLDNESITLLGAVTTSGEPLENVSLKRYTADFDSMENNLAVVLEENLLLRQLLENYIASVPTGGSGSGGGFGGFLSDLYSWILENKMIAGVAIIGVSLIASKVLSNSGGQIILGKP